MVLPAVRMARVEGSHLQNVLAVDMVRSVTRRSFERVLRNVLSFPSRPAVVVFMTMVRLSSFERSPTQENDMLTIAQHYQVPVLSTRFATCQVKHVGDIRRVCPHVHHLINLFHWFVTPSLLPFQLAAKHAAVSEEASTLLKSAV